jgi:hypothetical protein
VTTLERRSPDADNVQRTRGRGPVACRCRFLWKYAASVELAGLLVGCIAEALGLLQCLLYLPDGGYISEEDL